MLTRGRCWEGGKIRKEVIIGNATAGRLIPHCHPRPQIENIENIGEYTDSESISTLAPETNTDEDANHDSKYIRSDTEQREAEATSNNDDSEDRDIRSWANESLRYMAITRVPWQNRRSRRINGAPTAFDARIFARAEQRQRRLCHINVQKAFKGIGTDQRWGVSRQRLLHEGHLQEKGQR
jgi:hypothetical protein